MIQTPDLLPLDPVNTAEVVRAQREPARQRQSFARVFGGNAKSTSSEQAVVLHFGSQALSLARGQAGELERAEAEGLPASDAEAAEPAPEGAARAAERGRTPSGVSPFAPPVPADDRKRVDALRGGDREVRADEQARKALAGRLAGTGQLDDAVGSAGARHAVAGDAPTNVSPVHADLAATLREGEVVARAAHAPASPSGTDGGVAVQAARLSRQGRARVAAHRYAQAQELA
jgi:SprA family protein